MHCCSDACARRPMAAEEEATVRHVMSGDELPEREAAAEPQRVLSCDRTLLRKDAASWSGRDISSLYRSSTRQYASCTPSATSRPCHITCNNNDAQERRQELDQVRQSPCSPARTMNSSSSGSRPTSPAAAEAAHLSRPISSSSEATSGGAPTCQQDHNDEHASKTQSFRNSWLASCCMKNGWSRGGPCGTRCRRRGAWGSAGARRSAPSPAPSDPPAAALAVAKPHHPRPRTMPRSPRPRRGGSPGGCCTDPPYPPPLRLVQITSPPWLDWNTASQQGSSLPLL
jgi:hypothetical protein